MPDVDRGSTLASLLPGVSRRLSDETVPDGDRESPLAPSFPGVSRRLFKETKEAQMLLTQSFKFVLVVVSEVEMEDTPAASARVESEDW
jgi:hypothetical protein